MRKLDSSIPFCIGQGCSLDESFELTCNLTYNPPKLFTKSWNISIYNISESEIRILNKVAYRCYSESGHVIKEQNVYIDLRGTPFTLSNKNKFVVFSCRDYGVMGLMGGSNIHTNDEGDTTLTGCLGVCRKPTDMRAGRCYPGNGCCQTTIPKDVKFYYAELLSLGNSTTDGSACGYAFLCEEDSSHFGVKAALSNVTDFYERAFNVPILMDWVVGNNQSCSQDTECKGNSTCKDADIGG
ncbi:hypothetical protein L1887_22337 [Cichorium endivia]|nr:hypothetical protein L1887_22337 [Cichorium endivia]